MRSRTKVISFLFLALYIVAILSPFTPYVNYYLNKEKIAEEKCVNKDKPSLECDGKCYLKAQVISKQQEQEGKSSFVNVEQEKYVHDDSLMLESAQFYINDEVSEIGTVLKFNLLSRNFSVPKPPPKSLS